jgi:hypothetical protein
MINQISPVRQKTTALPQINKDLLKVRHIQARLNGRDLNPGNPRSRRGLMWSPLTPGPFSIPVTRWTE